MDNQFDEQALLQQAQAGAGMLAYRNDLRVQFYLHATRDELASTRELRPIYVDTVYIVTRASGTVDFMSRPATPDDIRRHAPEWTAFQARQDQAQTPISKLPTITPAEFLTLQELEVGSIEAFAERTPTPELARAHAVALRWVACLSVDAPVTPAAKKGGWPKGKPRKPREDTQAVA